MTQELSTEVSPEIINSLILTGDMSKLTPAQQTQYYIALCKSLDLNPITQPFAIIVLQGKKTLYATKGCTQQLCASRKISTEVKNRETQDSIYVVSARASMPDGRFTDDDGIVNIAGLKGSDLGNAMMKAVTKAKRRSVLALCGLGMPDESEVENISHATSYENGKSRVESLIEDQVEEAQLNSGAKNENSKSNSDNQKTQGDAKEPTHTETKTKAKSSKEKEKASPEVHKVDAKAANADTKQQILSGIKTVVGLIDNTIQGEGGEIECVKISKEPIINPNTGISAIKYSFLIRQDGVDIRYGTWDASLAKKIMECIDNRILVKFEYKERLGGKDNKTIFNDIVNFKQAEYGKDGEV